MHAERGVTKTKTGEVAEGRNIAATAAIHPAHSGGDINLLFERPVGNLHGKEKNDKHVNDGSVR